MNVKPTGAQGVWLVSSPEELHDVAVYRYRAGIWRCQRCHAADSDAIVVHPVPLAVDCLHIKAVKEGKR